MNNSFNFSDTDKKFIAFIKKWISKFEELDKTETPKDKCVFAGYLFYLLDSVLMELKQNSNSLCINEHVNNIIDHFTNASKDYIAQITLERCQEWFNDEKKNTDKEELDIESVVIQMMYDLNTIQIDSLYPNSTQLNYVLDELRKADICKGSFFKLQTCNYFGIDKQLINFEEKVKQIIYAFDRLNIFRLYHSNLKDSTSYPTFVTQRKGDM